MIKALVAPLPLALFALLVGEMALLLSWKKFARRERWALGSLAAGMILLWVPSLPIVAQFLKDSLERQYAPPSEIMLRKLGVIVILTGGYRKGIDPNSDELTADTYSRVKCGVQAFRQSGARWLVMSGSSYQRGDVRDGVLMQELTLKFGVPENQVLIEPYSRTTFEHPIELAKMKEIHPENRIGVVTSAWHIPRSVHEFKKHFREVVAIPCSYPTAPAPYGPVPFIPKVEALYFSTTLLHEYIGSAWYQVCQLIAQNAGSLAGVWK